MKMTVAAGGGRTPRHRGRHRLRIRHPLTPPPMSVKEPPREEKGYREATVEAKLERRPQLSMTAPAVPPRARGSAGSDEAYDPRQRPSPFSRAWYLRR